MRSIKGIIGAVLGTAIGILLTEIVFVGFAGNLMSAFIVGLVFGIGPMLFVALSEHQGSSLMKNVGFGALGALVPYIGLMVIASIYTMQLPTVDSLPLLLLNLASSAFAGALGGFGYRFLAGPKPDNY
jgi:hypothetical protein